MNRKKRIVLAIGSLSGGGAERVVSVWANELAENGYQVYIYVFFRTSNEYYVSDKIKIFSLAETQDKLRAISKVKAYIKSRRFLKEVAPNYIISFLFLTEAMMMFASLGLKTTLIETIRVNPWEREKYRGRIANLIYKLCYNASKTIIAQTSDQIPWLSPKNQKKAIVIPNPIAEQYVATYKTEISEQVTEFIAAGRIAEQKNYKMMIDGFADACKLYPHIRLRIFGSGTDSYMEKIRAHIDSKGLSSQITLEGRNPHMEKEYSKGDVFLMTSDFEGLPNALMEAMASQLICISTDCKTGPRDLIDEGRTGFLVPTGDYKSLTRAICKVIEMSKEERVEMAQAAREKILTHCSQENSIAKLCSILK